MADIWLLLIAFNILINIIPVFIFRHTKFLYYFVCLALLDPAFIILYYLFNIPTYYFMPMSISLLLLVLPYKDRKNIYWGMLSSILLLPYFYFPKLLPSVITLMASFYIIYFFVEEIKEELQTASSLSFFLLILILITIKDNAKVMLYYIQADFLRDQFALFLFSSSILSLLLIILGPNTKLRTSWLLNIGLFDIPQTNATTINHKINEDTFSNLTPMEKKVLYLFGEGLRSKQIAEKLFVSPRTIYFHSNNLRSKLGFSTTQQLIKYSSENSAALKEIEKPVNSTQIFPLKTKYFYKN